MIDTLMVLWNKGYGGRGILLSGAFLVLCISISLLLVTVHGILIAYGSPSTPHTSVVTRAGQTATAPPPSSGNTPVAQTPTVQVPGNTPAPTSTAPTPTPTPPAAYNCTSASARGDGDAPLAASSPVSPVVQKGGGHGGNGQPTPTASPTPAITPTVSPTLTPVGSTGGNSRHPLNTNGGGPLPTTVPSGPQNCQNNPLGNTIGATGDGSVLALLQQNSICILGGSATGTMLFYLMMYVIHRKRSI